MKDKFCAFERRTKMLFYISQAKFVTRLELTEEFNVSLATINRDIYILGGIAPIYTKQGNGGGIYILPEYRSYKNYLTDAEENFLYSLMPLVSNKEKRIEKNLIHCYSSFRNQNRWEELNACDI